MFSVFKKQFVFHIKSKVKVEGQNQVCFLELEGLYATQCTQCSVLDINQPLLAT